MASKTTAAKTTTPKDREEALKSLAASFPKASPAALAIALDKANGDLALAEFGLSLTIDVKEVGKEENKKKKAAAESAKAEEKAALMRILNLAFAKSKKDDRPALPAHFRLRDEMRVKEAESATGFKDRLVGIRFKAHGVDNCLQAVIPLWRKEEINVSKEDSDKAFDLHMARIMKDVFTLIEV